MSFSSSVWEDLAINTGIGAIAILIQDPKCVRAKRWKARLVKLANAILTAFES
jgi:hypothetical protein